MAKTLKILMWLPGFFWLYPVWLFWFSTPWEIRGEYADRLCLLHSLWSGAQCGGLAVLFLWVIH